jgi:small subunit ribosomal protein S13
MPRILAVEVPGRKRLVIAMTYIFGIGPTLSKKLLNEMGLDHDMKAEKLTPEQISKINAHLQNNYLVEGDKRREVQGNIKRLTSIRCYRGIRHQKGLPVRGQRTSTNARTRKGKKKTVSGKKK